MPENWSNYQLEIFKHTSLGEQSLLIEASAGSGKSKSLIESVKRLDSNLSWFLTSFGTKIVDKLKEEAPQDKKGEVKTLHSFGLKCLYKTFGQDVVIDKNKVLTLIDKTIGKKLKNKELPWQLSQAVDKCKLTLVSSKDEIKEVIERFDIDLCETPIDEFINHVSFLLNLNKKFYKIVDMTDMVYLHHVVKTNIQQFDRVFIDEFQDFSRCEIDFIFKIVKPTGKCYAYGDQFQGIYYWKSADPESFKRYESKFSPLKLSLPISYRCPIAVVNYAKKYNPDIEARPGANQGKIETISMNEMFKLASPGCFILSRYNAPIVSVAMKLVASKIPCNIQGRDLGENLINIIKRSRTKTIEKFLEYLDKWKAKEMNKVMTSHNKDSSKIIDTYQCMQALSQSCETIEQMKSNIDNLFYDGDNHQRIILSSIHRAKGLQRDNVFVLKSTLRESNQEERNLIYVAVTRSANNLFFVESEKKKNKKEDIDLSDEEIINSSMEELKINETLMPLCFNKKRKK